VQERALLQEELAGGGQLLYPLVDDEWRADPARAEAVRAALAAAGGEAFASIHLGGTAVLAGSDAGMAALAQALPPLEVGRNRYPLKLAGHGPYHTPLCAPVAARARETLADLRWQRPRITLIDGRGRRFTPWSSDPAALRDYSLGEQVTTTFDFTRAVRVALREHAPDELVLPGPGNTLGGACAQILIAEGRLASRTDFERAQAEPGAPVRSLRR
jgi:acyl transferase domain-containing protein